MDTQDFDTSDLSLLAQHTTSHLAQQAIYQLDSNSYAESLAMNTNLNHELWESLYRHPNFSYKATLFMYAPTQKQASFLLKEQNPELQLLALECGVNNLSSKMIEEFLTTQEDLTPLLPALLYAGELTEELAAKLWRSLYELYNSYQQDSIAFLDALTTVVTKYQILNDAQVIEVLELLYKNIHGRDNRYIFNICHMVDYRPTLIPLLLQSPYRENFFLAVVTSQHLRAGTATLLYDAILEKAPPR